MNGIALRMKYALQNSDARKCWWKLKSPVYSVIENNLEYWILPDSFSVVFFQNAMKAFYQEEVVHRITQHMVKGSCNVWRRRKGKPRLLCGIKQETEASLKLQIISNNSLSRELRWRNLSGQLNRLCAVPLRSVKILIG